MAGHSKWAQIKRKKAVVDATRGKVFSRLVKEITVAARIGGGDPDGNPRLRSAIDAAKKENMPIANIDRAIQKGTGELPGAQIDEVTYEGYGPGGAAILVQATTDNRNRTVAEIRKIFEKGGGNMGDVNSVSWMFRQVGYFAVDASTIKEDDLLMIALEAGAEDVKNDDGTFEVTCQPTDFHKVQTSLQEAGVVCETEELAMLPNTYLKLEGRDAERVLGLVEKLEDNDDVQNVWTNVDIDQDVLDHMAAG